MGNYTPEQVERIANKLRYSGTDEFSEEAADAMDAYAATLRQQAGRVDEGMVERVQAALNANLPVEYLHTKSEVRAALAQNTQGEDYSELGNKYVAEAVERLRLALGELTENAGAIGIISVAAVRIDRLQAERARVPDVVAIMEHLPDNRAATRAELIRAMALAAAPSQRAEVK